MSVGVLVVRDGRLLLIDRKRPPYGLAAPAGHVDDHGDPTDSEEEQSEKAAMDELCEETGLRASKLTLLTEGRKENPCRRGGEWHYWRIYMAEAEGGLELSEEETRGHRWCSQEELRALLQEGLLEPVWEEWFDRLGNKIFEQGTTHG